ncbi:MAG: M14 family zinc carboxypeptidase [Planctomycetota bacterium]|nr:M14 family zinc carboxypeptidase [Planctomycetota bacterium]
MYHNRFFKVLFLTLACSLTFPAVGADGPDGYEGYQVVRVTLADRADLAAFRALRTLGADFQMWSETARLGPVQVRLAPAARPALLASGLRFDVVINDLQKHLDTLYAGGRGFFDSLRSYDEHVQFMNDLVAAHPDLAEMVQIGQSVEGRPMWAIRITGPGQTKPAVVFHGAEHGNEQAGASVVSFLARHLLANYGSDDAITALVDDVEWFLLPIMNPDGYVRFDRWNANGVDLNRNWDGPGAGEDPWGGPYPFSEPETAAMRDFFLAHPTARVHIDWHGYVPWIMWPWGHIPDECPDHATYHDLGAQMRELVSLAGGGWYEIGTIYNVAYPVSGCSCNWVYGVEERWSFAIEVVDDDMPEICEEFLSSQLLLGQWIADTDCNGNGVEDGEDIASGTSEDLNANGVPDECECLGDMDGDHHVSTADLLTLLGSWGECPDSWGECPWDFNGDHVVDDLDEDILMDHWGDCPDPPEECPWDLDGDGTVDFQDLTELQEHFGLCPHEACPTDLDGDGETGAADLLVLLGAWGECP